MSNAEPNYPMRRRRPECRPECRRRRIAFFALLVLFAATVRRDGAVLAGADPGDDLSVERIVESSRGAVVVITSASGLGSGFIVRADAAGLDLPAGKAAVVVTNLHVIGQGRSFEVERLGGGFLEPTAVLAFDRRADLALIRVEGDNLPSLELADSGALRAGQSVLSIGHPLGLRHSVTKGVVAETREVHGQLMIQLAMPIERGNSGGPLLDRAARVVGVVAVKSGVSLGFAVPSSAVERLLARPRPIPVARWARIGAVLPADWQPLMGGEWRQSPAMLTARGQGTGFGGRMILLSRHVPPARRFEAAVEVRLEDESGAAGLAFHADGGDRHYGFYPTGGRLRLTRFDGPDVFSWTILETLPSEHYRLGDWNEIRVKVDGARLSCSVNGHAVIDVEDGGLDAGRVGLVKFRAPGADFRRFRVAPELPPGAVSPEIAAEVLKLAERLSPHAAPDSATIRSLAAFGASSVEVLAARAAALKKEAARLEHVADLVHRRTIETRLAALFAAPDEKVDLLEAALLVAALDDRELDHQAHVAFVDRIAREVRESVPGPGPEKSRLDALIGHFFGELGFAGSPADSYYERANSYISKVLEDRDGIPITLAVLFMACAERLELRVEGLGVPYHFVVRFVPDEGESEIIDVFDGGKRLDLHELGVLSRGALEEHHLRAASRRSIIVRMLRNLRGVAELEQDLYGRLRYLDVILVLEPDSAIDRWERAALRYQTAQLQRAAEDLRWLSEHPAPGIDPRQVEELLRRLE